jgi:hypothetical protein
MRISSVNSPLKSSRTAAKSFGVHQILRHTSFLIIDSSIFCQSCIAISTTTRRWSSNASTLFKSSLSNGNILQVSLNFVENPSVTYENLFAGLLNSTFEILYDNDVLSLEAFDQWKNSEDPNEDKGK